MAEKKKDDTILVNIRMERSLRDTFKNVCKNNDDDMAKVVRRLIREYIKNNQQGGLIS